MGGDLIQARYEELENIARGFNSAAEANTALYSRITSGLRALEKDWEGKGKNAFFAEMDRTVCPALQRLIDALAEAHTVTLAAKAILQAAEEEAASPFHNGHGPGFHSSSASPGEPIPELVTTPEGTFDKKRVAYTVSKPQEVADHPFRSGKADALKYEVTIGKQKIPVYVPKDPKAVTGGKIHSIDQVAKGLAALPEANRQLVKQVTINPGPNPDDAYWAKEYKDPNFSSYMTAGADGIIDIYPSHNAQGQHVVDGSMIHETGHIWSRQNWGSNDDKRWDDWKKAIQTDPDSASRYASSSPGEDFSETVRLYHQVKGTPQEAEYRKKMPDRFKIIDEIEAGKR